MQFHNNKKIFNTVFPRVSCFICRCFHLKFGIIIIINVFFDYLNPFVKPYRKHLVIVTLRSITRFFPINCMSYLPRSRQRTAISSSERWDNYELR